MQLLTCTTEVVTKQESKVLLTALKLSETMLSLLQLEKVLPDMNPPAVTFVQTMKLDEFMAVKLLLSNLRDVA